MYQKDVNERSPMRVFERSIHGGLGKGNVGVVLSRAGIGKTTAVRILADELAPNLGQWGEDAEPDGGTVGMSVKASTAPNTRATTSPGPPAAPSTRPLCFRSPTGATSSRPRWPETWSIGIC